MEPSLLQFYISRQWLNKFKTFAEPGPISNNDFLCIHGGKECCYVNSGRGSLLNPLQINKEPWISSPHIPIWTWTWVYLIPYGSEIGPVWNLTLELRMPETVPCCESLNFELESDTWVANYGRVSPLHACSWEGRSWAVWLLPVSLVNRWLSGVWSMIGICYL